MVVVIPIPESPVAGPSRVKKEEISGKSFGTYEDPYFIQEDLEEVVSAIRGSKRMVVVCGAGISTAARIPDFRSAQGLFRSSTIKGKGRRGRTKGKGKAENQGNVKDLFHIDSLVDENLYPSHIALLNHLYRLSDKALPTPTHNFLANLNNQGRLLRCYTQNIDGLEEKAGLEVGIPIIPRKTSTPRRRKAGYPPTPTPSINRESSNEVSIPINPTISIPSTPPRINQDNRVLLTPPSSQFSSSSSSTSETATPSSPAQIALPRVIPLHGTLTTISCTKCSSLLPSSNYFPLPPTLLECTSCNTSQSARQISVHRPRSSGILRPSIVLYGEEHPHSQIIGSIIEKDLKGLKRPGEKEGKVDFLLVMGSSLSIPGVKRLIKEMSRSIDITSESKGTEGIKKVYVNDSPPKGTGKEWEDVFDVWIKGDIQQFIKNYVENQKFAMPKVKPPSIEEIKVKRPYKRKNQESMMKVKDEGDIIRTPTKRKKNNSEVVDGIITPTSLNGASPTPIKDSNIRVGKKKRGRPSKRIKVELSQIPHLIFSSDSSSFDTPKKVIRPHLRNILNNTTPSIDDICSDLSDIEGFSDEE